MTEESPSINKTLDDIDTSIEVNFKRDGVFTPQGKHKVKRLQLKKLPKWKSDLNKSVNRSLNKSRALRAISSASADSSSSFVKWSLRSNNRALAQRLEQAKKELRFMNETNLRLQKENLQLKQSIQSGIPFRDEKTMEDKLREDVDALVEQKLQIKLDELKLALSKPSMLLLEAGQSINSIMDQCLQSKRSLSDDIKNSCSSLLLNKAAVTNSEISVIPRKPLVGFGSPKRVLKSQIPQESPPIEALHPSAIDTIIEASSPENTKLLKTRRETFIVPPAENRRETFAVLPPKDTTLFSNTEIPKLLDANMGTSNNSNSVVIKSPTKISENIDKRKTFCVPPKNMLAVEGEEGIFEQDCPILIDEPYDSPDVVNSGAKTDFDFYMTENKTTNSQADENQTVFLDQDMELTEVINFNPIQHDSVFKPSSKYSAMKADKFVKPNTTLIPSAKKKAKNDDSCKTISKSVKSLNSVMLQIKDNQGETKNCASVGLSMPKPGKIVFNASRKDMHGSRMPLSSKLPTKTRSKDKLKKVSQKQENHQTVKSIFDFHDKTPDFRKEERPKSVFDLSMNESLPQDVTITVNNEGKSKTSAVDNKQECKPSVLTDRKSQEKHKPSNAEQKTSILSKANKKQDEFQDVAKNSDTEVSHSKSSTVIPNTLAESPIVVTDGKKIIHCFPIKQSESEKKSLAPPHSECVTDTKKEERKSKSRPAVNTTSDPVVTKDGCIMYSLPMKKSGSECETSPVNSKEPEPTLRRSRSQSRSRKSPKNLDDKSEVSSDDNRRSNTDSEKDKQEDKRDVKPRTRSKSRPRKISKPDNNNVDSEKESDAVSRNICSSKMTRSRSRPRMPDVDLNDEPSPENSHKKERLRGRSRSRRRIENGTDEREDDKDIKVTRSKSRQRKKDDDLVDDDFTPEKVPRKSRGRSKSQRRRNSDAEGRDNTKNIPILDSPSQQKILSGAEFTDSNHIPEKHHKKQSRGRSRSRKRVCDGKEACEESENFKMTRSKSRQRKVTDVNPDTDDSSGKSLQHGKREEQCDTKQGLGEGDSNADVKKLTTMTSNSRKSNLKLKLADMLNVDSDSEDEIIISRKSRGRSRPLLESTDDVEATDNKANDKSKSRGRSKSRPRNSGNEIDKNLNRKRNHRSKSRPRSPVSEENSGKHSKEVMDKDGTTARSPVKAQDNGKKKDNIFKMPVVKDFKKIDADVDVTIRPRQFVETPAFESSFTNFDSMLESSATFSTQKTNKVDSHAFLKAIKSKSGSTDYSNLQTKTDLSQTSEPKVDALSFLKAMRTSGSTSGKQATSVEGKTYVKTSQSKSGPDLEKQLDNIKHPNSASSGQIGFECFTRNERQSSLKLTDSSNSIALSDKCTGIQTSNSFEEDDSSQQAKRRKTEDRSSTAKESSQDRSSVAEQNLIVRCDKLEELKRRLTLMKQSAVNREARETDSKNKNEESAQPEKELSGGKEKENEAPRECVEELSLKRSRRAASNKVSYAEPTLGTKLRRGDPFTSTLYSDVPLYKSPAKKSQQS